MDENKVNTCALLDGEKQRLARGRFDRAADGSEITFMPASNVTSGEMARVAFLWPDDGDPVPVSNVRPGADDELHYRMDAGPA